LSAGIIMRVRRHAARTRHVIAGSRIRERPGGRVLTFSRVLAGLSCLLAAVSGCAEPPASSAPVTLVFKHARILGPANPVPQLLADFEARHPGVRVKAESLPWSSDEQRQFFVINLEGGRPGFDVMMLDVVWTPEFARAGWLLDLTPRLRPGELDAFFPSAVEAATHQDRVWGLPWNMNVGLLYYRADLLARYGLEPPATYGDLVAQVARVRAGERNSRLQGFLWQGKQYEGLVVNVLEGLWAAGTELLAADGTVFPDPSRAEAVLAFMGELIATGVSPPWTTAADEELTRRTFGNGEAIFLRNWPYALSLLESPDSPVRGKVGVAPLPRHAGRSRGAGPTGGARGAGSTGGSHLAVHRGTRHPELALELVRALTSPEAQRLMVTAAALYPSRPALYRAPDLVSGNPGLPTIAALTFAGRPRPVTPYYLTLSTILQPELSAALVRVKSPAQAVADARRAIDFVLRAARADVRAGASASRVHARDERGEDPDAASHARGQAWAPGATRAAR
jgi:multiple sugar transport system substrate-binding protein